MFQELLKICGRDLAGRALEEFKILDRATIRGVPMGGERSGQDGKDRVQKNLKKILDKIHKRYGNVLRRLAGRDCK